jgi:hypothetical protein
MLLISIRLQDHAVRVSGALETAFRMISVAAATDTGMDWNVGRYYIVIVDDGSFIPILLPHLYPSFAPISISC